MTNSNEYHLNKNNLTRQQTKKNTAKLEAWEKSVEGERPERPQQRDLTYLSEQHHVLHDKGDVEQRGKTVEEVELRKEKKSTQWQWDSEMHSDRSTVALAETVAAIHTHHQHFEHQVILVGRLKPVIF